MGIRSQEDTRQPMSEAKQAIDEERDVDLGPIQNAYYAAIQLKAKHPKDVQ